MKKLTLVCREKYGSSVMRGHQMAQALRTVCGMDVEVRESVDGTRNGVVVFLKFATPQAITTAKANGNRVFIDVVDRLAYKIPIEEFLSLSMADGVICASSAAAGALLATNKNTHVVLHHWDPALEEAQQRYQAYPYELRFGYIGMSFNHKDWEHLAPIMPVYHPAAWVEMAPLFNCHFSVRDPRDALSRFKPATKLVTASALANTCIVMAREAANLELMPSEYPYYVPEYTEEAVLMTLAKVCTTFNTVVWWDAVRMMKEVKGRTDLRAVCKDYAKIVGEA
jgi:hypothetical protein